MHLAVIPSSCESIASTNPPSPDFPQPFSILEMKVCADPKCIFHLETVRSMDVFADIFK